MSGEDYRESVQKLGSEFLEVPSRAWHNEGSNDYKNTYIDIVKIVDREGKEHDPVWGEEPVEVIPGVTTRKEDRGHLVRIARGACPLRVLFREYFEYVSYDSWEHNSSWTSYWWIRYES